MRSFVSAALPLLLFQPGYSSATANTMKVFLLENTSANQWCAYRRRATWKKAVQEAGAMTVATLNYSNDRLSQLDVTQTDESGDWTVYDHYFVDQSGRIVKLSRTINVLPGNESVLQTFSIANGKAHKVATTAKQLGTGRPLSSPEADWLPELPIRTGPAMFPFSALLARTGLRTGDKVCAPASKAGQSE